MKLSPESLPLLYGNTFYLNSRKQHAASSDEAPGNDQVQKNEFTETPAIDWKEKANSVIYFIAEKDELFDSELGEFLKKIVASIEIPFESAGFGIVSKPAGTEELFSFRGRYAVLFGAKFSSESGLLEQDGKQLFITGSLSDLKSNKDLKLGLWNFLKGIKGDL